MEQLNFNLQTGVLNILIEGKSSHYSACDLFKIAERYNPKRSFLFVSTVLGKHYPSCINEMEKTYQALTATLPDDLENILVIGMAETAVGLGMGVYKEIYHRYGQAVFGATTRYPKDSKIMGNFHEPHSHAVDQYLLEPIDGNVKDKIKNAKTLILVDDEITTGKTISNLANALIKSATNNIEKIFFISLTDWSGDAFKENTFPSGIAIDRISLIKGQWHWQGNGKSFELPEFNSISGGVSVNSAPINTGKFWLEAPTKSPLTELIFKKINFNKEDRVVIIGCAEYLADPFQSAQEIQPYVKEIYFSSTTRSPAIPADFFSYEGDYGISSKITFPDIYGAQGMNYLYNISPSEWDHIIFCTDIAAKDVPSEMLSSLPNLSVISAFEVDYDQGNEYA